MPSGVPYNGLGQIIIDGGVLATANLINNGQSYQYIVGYFQDRYIGAPADDILALIGLAILGIDGGSAATAELGTVISGYTVTPGEEFTVLTPDGSVSIGFEQVAELAGEQQGEAGPASEVFNLETLPIIPGLFGDDPAGVRAELSLQVRPEGGRSVLRIDLDLSGAETWAEILELVANKVGEIRGSDESKLTDEEGNAIELFQVLILYGARRW